MATGATSTSPPARRSNSSGNASARRQTDAERRKRQLFRCNRLAVRGHDLIDDPVGEQAEVPLLLAQPGDAGIRRLNPGVLAQRDLLVLDDNDLVAAVVVLRQPLEVVPPEIGFRE